MALDRSNWRKPYSEEELKDMWRSIEVQSLKTTIKELEVKCAALEQKAQTLQQAYSLEQEKVAELQERLNSLINS